MPGNATNGDRHGYTISTASFTAAARYQDGVDLYMSGNAGGEAALREAMAADPEFALAPAALTAVLRDSGRHDEARESAALARDLAAGVTRREKSHVEAIAVMADGDGPRSFELMKEHLAEFPRDALILLRADRYLFYSGGENRQQLQRELLDGFAGAYDDDWWFPGQYGFALGECGHHDKAVAVAERSLALNPKNFWAAHTLAHVHADTKDDEKGAAFLGPWLSDFDSRAPMFGHSSWHLTLFELGRCRHRRAMEIYETGVRPAVCKHRSTLNNSASFLWRCMVYGYRPTAGQWDEIQPLAERIAGPARGEWDGMNAALAFAGAGNETGKKNLVAGLEKLGQEGRMTAVEIGLPLVEGAWAFAHEDYDATIRLMAPAIGRIEDVGGSNAQHEVYWDALIEAYLRTDRFAEAETLQRSRLEPRPTARDLFRLGRARIGAGKRKKERPICAKPPKAGGARNRARPRSRRSTSCSNESRRPIDHAGWRTVAGRARGTGTARPRRAVSRRSRLRPAGRPAFRRRSVSTRSSRRRSSIQSVDVCRVRSGGDGLGLHPDIEFSIRHGV